MDAIITTTKVRGEQMTTTPMEKYYLKADHQAEWSEVTREQFIAAEQAAGFHSKFGSNHSATGGFRGSGMRGRVEYVTEQPRPEQGSGERNDKMYSKSSRQTKQHIHTCMFCGQSGTELSNEQHSTLIEQRERLIDGIRDVAIRSLLYCEQKYDHDDQARLNLEALLESVLTTIEQEGTR